MQNQIYQKEKTRKLAFGAVFCALSVLCVFLASILPVNRISLYALASFFTSIIVIESGIKSSFVFYTAVTLLAFIAVPDKTAVVPYVSFFGLYGMAKYYIEKINKTIPELIIKYAFFNANLLLAIFFAVNILSLMVKPGIAIYLLVIGLEIAFIIYDYVYTLFINYYNSTLKALLSR